MATVAPAAEAVGDTSPVCSYNSWDPLEEVIVGRIDYATMPTFTPEVKVRHYDIIFFYFTHNTKFFQACTHVKNWDWFGRDEGKFFPAERVELVRQEVENLCDVLKAEGVIVRRPDPVDWSKTYETPDFKACGNFTFLTVKIYVL